jgi:hypothetical protein
MKILQNKTSNPSFLKEAVDELLTYYTPIEIVKHIEMCAIIENPPYDTKRTRRT